MEQSQSRSESPRTSEPVAVDDAAVGDDDIERLRRFPASRGATPKSKTIDKNTDFHR